MANQDQQARTGASAATTQKFSEMTAVGKLVHIVKVIIFVCTFGFAFPTIFSD